MANPEHLAILTQGVEKWNIWRKDHPDAIPDLSLSRLSEVDLRGADLRGADLSRADLRDVRFVLLAGANLSEATLSYADLSGANLSGANLSKARLMSANLTDANLSRASLRAAGARWSKLIRADLFGADLSGADLGWAELDWADFGGANSSGTDFTGASTSRTQFTDIDLRDTKGLETIRHKGPSTIGIDTIYKSHGKIPEAFLRGCGVPDEYIALARNMAGSPIEFYSCFISYSGFDQDFAERLHADLQAKGVRCWFAPYDIKGGRNIHEQIDEAIRLHDRLLLILSKHSMGSDWVRTEIAKARKREKEGKRVLFPVRLVTYEAMRSWEYIDSSGKDLAEEIRQYFIPDFSKWKEHDSYQAALGRLVSDLKTG